MRLVNWSILACWQQNFRRIFFSSKFALKWKLKNWQRRNRTLALPPSLAMQFGARTQRGTGARERFSCAESQLPAGMLQSRSNSANCTDEEGLIFNLLPGESNRIFPPSPQPFFNDKTPELECCLPSFWGLFGSGSGSGCGSGSRRGFLTEIEQEYKPVDEHNALYYNCRPLKRSLSSDN